MKFEDKLNCMFLYGSGGGAASGSETPEYLKHAHEQIIDGDWSASTPTSYLNTSGFLLKLMEVLIEDNNSPYFNETAYDPDADIAAALVEAGEFDTLVDALAEVTDFNTRHSNAVTKADADFSFSSLATAINTAVASATAALSETAISNAVTAFQSSQESRQASRLSELGAGAADINAVHSSAYILAEALIKAEGAKEVTQFESQLKLDSFKRILASQLEVIIRKEMARDAYVASAVQEMNRLALAKIEAFKANAIIYQDHYKMKIVAKKEQSREDLELDVQDALWDMEIQQRGANVLAAVQGASTLVEPKMSPFQSGLSGLTSGAAAGAAIGSVVPGVGTGVGAVLGGVVGLAGGLFD